MLRREAVSLEIGGQLQPAPQFGDKLDQVGRVRVLRQREREVFEVVVGRFEVPFQQTPWGTWRIEPSGWPMPCTAPSPELEKAIAAIMLPSATKLRA